MSRYFVHLDVVVEAPSLKDASHLVYVILTEAEESRPLIKSKSYVAGWTEREISMNSSQQDPKRDPGIGVQIQDSATTELQRATETIHSLRLEQSLNRESIKKLEWAIENYKKRLLQYETAAGWKWL